MVFYGAQCFLQYIMGQFLFLTHNKCIPCTATEMIPTIEMIPATEKIPNHHRNDPRHRNDPQSPPK